MLMMAVAYHDESHGNQPSRVHSRLHSRLSQLVWSKSYQIPLLGPQVHARK